MSQGDGERRKELVLIPSRSILAKMFYKIARLPLVFRVTNSHTLLVHPQPSQEALTNCGPGY